MAPRWATVWCYLLQERCDYFIFMNKKLSVCFQVIVTEASKVIQEVGRSWRPAQIAEGETMVRMGSFEGPTVFRSPSKSWKVIVGFLVFLNTTTC